MQRAFCFLAATLLVSVVAVGCGDDALSDPNGDDGDNQQNQQTDQNDGDGPSPDDCADDEYFHPVHEECREDTDSGDNNDEEDNNGENDDPEVNDDEDNDDEVDECGLGQLQGESCRPDGGMLPGATVLLEGEDCEDGESFQMETTADNDGIYHFEDVPSGTHELTVSSGSFTNTEYVSVLPGETTDLTDETAKICLEDDDVEIAVFEGSFDDVGSLLDNMDIDYDAYSGPTGLDSQAEDVWLNSDELLQYDIVFIECQINKPAPGEDRDIAMANFREFVHQGNSVYASDRAHPWMNNAFPDAFPFLVDDVDDQQTDPGGATGTYTADVISDEMYTLLDQNTVDFHFDTGNWSIVDADEVGSAGTVHFELDPDKFSGSDVYEGASVVTTYDDPIGDGRMIFTSFHNSAQDQIDTTMEEILEFMIFQL